MDVNGTRLHLLAGREDWLAAYASGGAVDAAGVYWDRQRDSLTLRPLIFSFPTPAGDVSPLLSARRGAGRDRYGNWYWIASNETEIHFAGREAHDAQVFWRVAELAGQGTPPEDAAAFVSEMPPAAAPGYLRGLAVTGEHYLLVGTSDPDGLLLFDLHAGGPPLTLRWEGETPFAPFEIIPAADGGVWILDDDPESPGQPPRLWKLNRRFRIEAQTPPGAPLPDTQPDAFQPEDPTQPPREGQSIPLAAVDALAVTLAVTAPHAMDTLPDGSVLILDSPDTDSHSTLYRYRDGALVGAPLALDDALSAFAELGDPSAADPFALRGFDMAFIADTQQPIDGISGTLYIVENLGNQAFAFLLTGDANSLDDLELLPRYMPMRRFSGVGLVPVGDRAYYHSLQNRWLTLAAQPRPRFANQGALESRVLDGKTYDCIWHRLLLDATIPPETEVIVESRAANQEELLKHMNYQPEPSLIRRHSGAEIPYHTPDTRDEREQAGVGTWELLFQAAKGQYIQVRLRLRGNGRRSPSLRALRVHYPRFSYLNQYLPAVYQQDPTSASFMDRFLANTEGLLTPLEGHIADIQALVDVYAAPRKYVDWLAGWLGILFQPDWDEAKRRFFLDNAPKFFRQRGTLAGMIRVIRLVIDDCLDLTLFDDDALLDRPGFHVRIVEHFLTRRAPGVVFGDPSGGGEMLTLPALSEWTPAQGAAPLHRRYRDDLRRRYGDDIHALRTAWGVTGITFETIQLSPVLPANEAQQGDWLAFMQSRLGFTYAIVTQDDVEAYQSFLVRRYGSITALNQTYATEYSYFVDIPLPGENDFPRTGTRLRDWIQFVSLALPLGRNAHQFTVLVPTRPGESQAALETRLARVRQVVRQEKPTHTVFEARPYWAAFRVNEARLGLETVLETGSRFMALALGTGALAAGYLPPEHPWGVPDRRIVGRDAANR